MLFQRSRRPLRHYDLDIGPRGSDRLEEDKVLAPLTMKQGDLKMEDEWCITETL